jgi:hypothetical protein
MASERGSYEKAFRERRLELVPFAEGKGFIKLRCSLRLGREPLFFKLSFRVLDVEASAAVGIAPTANFRTICPEIGPVSWASASFVLPASVVLPRQQMTFVLPAVGALESSDRNCKCDSVRTRSHSSSPGKLHAPITVPIVIGRSTCHRIDFSTRI